jgi:hypothetical protein
MQDGRREGRQVRGSWAAVGVYGAREHLIRRSGQVVRPRPLRCMGWAEIPELSAWDRRCPAPWQQSRQNGPDPGPSAFREVYHPESTYLERLQQGSSRALTLAPTGHWPSTSTAASTRCPPAAPAAGGRSSPSRTRAAATSWPGNSPGAGPGDNTGHVFVVVDNPQILDGGVVTVRV